MHIYSRKIIQFIQEIESSVKNILRDEVRLQVHGDRFYNHNKTKSFPINIVVYNNKQMVGYFDSSFYELGFHECLMFTNKEQLHQVIRHELAHYITYINYGNVLPHGIEFKTFCLSMGWGEHIQRATICLEGADEAAVFEENNILRKVQKLMALANSSNKHEAELAMIKSQQLLLKHNIESKYLGNDEEKMFLKRILKQKKIDAKLTAIANILKTFFVKIVYNRANEYTYLEILGTSTNVEIAEYVASILVEELDRLWFQAQKESGLKGTIAKNSFFYGLAKGYCNKIQALQREYSHETSQALMVIEKQLIDATEMAYKRLRSSTSNGHYCPESSSVGERMGSQLNINPAISSSKKGTLLEFLT